MPYIQIIKFYLQIQVELRVLIRNEEELGELIIQVQTLQ